MARINKHPAPVVTCATDVPACLLALPDLVKAQLNAALCNNDMSDDEELRAHWIAELGLSEIQADAALTYRPRCLVETFFQVFPETF